MKLIQLSAPPNPKGVSADDWAQQMYDWAYDARGKIESASKINDVPCDRAIGLGTFTLVTSITGTSSAASVANAVCTLIQILTDKGILKPVTTT